MVFTILPVRKLFGGSYGYPVRKTGRDRPEEPSNVPRARIQIFLNTFPVTCIVLRLEVI
jgi:hypothetical protein